MNTTASIDWDRTPPRVPVLGSDDINNAPYTETAEDASLYESYTNSLSPALHETLDSLTGLTRWLKSFYVSDRPQCSDDMLMEMILKDYPRRTDILVDVMDFSPTRFERTQQKLQNVSACKLILTQGVSCANIRFLVLPGLDKPQWSVVRWMSVALAVLHVSILFPQEVHDSS